MLAREVVLGAQPDDGLQLGDAADEGPPASSVISSTLLAMVSSVSRRPTVPCPFVDARGDALDVLHGLVEVVDGRLQLGRASCARRCRSICTSPSLVPTSVLIDSVMSRTFLIDSLTSPASDGRNVFDVRRDVIDAVEQALEHHRVGLDQLVDVGRDVGDAARTSACGRPAGCRLQDRQTASRCRSSVAHDGRLDARP